MLYEYSSNLQDPQDRKALLASDGAETSTTGSVLRTCVTQSTLGNYGTLPSVGVNMGHHVRLGLYRAARCVLLDSTILKCR
jgi:hypothetical protein